jgi:hypothetical protein
MVTKRKATKYVLAALDRKVAALELRRAGCTYDVIARRLGYANRSGAWHAVRAGLNATLQEPADALRTMELERLDALQEAVWDRATSGVDGVLSIMRRRAALLGLDAPKTQAVASDVTVERMAAWMAARYSLDVAAVLAEAERMLAEVRGG